MSATTPTPDKPRRCLTCDRQFAFRMRERVDDGFGISRYYRHHGRGYVYFHEIYTSGPTPTTRDPPIDAAAYHGLLVDELLDL